MGLERLLRYCACPPVALEHLHQRDAGVYEAFPLLCPLCHAKMRIIAFLNDAGTVTNILVHIGESPQPSCIAPARGLPLWKAAAAEQQA